MMAPWAFWGMFLNTGVNTSSTIITQMAASTKTWFQICVTWAAAQNPIYCMQMHAYKSTYKDKDRQAKASRRGVKVTDDFYTSASSWSYYSIKYMMRLQLTAHKASQLRAAANLVHDSRAGEGAGIGVAVEAGAHNVGNAQGTQLLSGAAHRKAAGVTTLDESAPLTRVRQQLT